VTVFIAILLAGIGTYLSRAVFILALAQRRFPPLALRALEYVAPAVLGALIVTMLTGADGQVFIGPAEVIGLLVAATVARRSRDHVLTIVTAMGAFWVTAFLL